MADKQSDYWMPGDMTFVHYGEGFRVAPDLSTYSVGKIADIEPPQNTTNPPPAKEKPIMQQGIGSKPLGAKVPRRIMQHKNGEKRGRPLKDGDVHRTTLWRRKKRAEQGLLF